MVSVAYEPNSAPVHKDHLILQIICSFLALWAFPMSAQTESLTSGECELELEGSVQNLNLTAFRDIFLVVC